MPDHVTFLLNGEVVRVRELTPATTLLAYLRRTRRLMGTKEGCGEGDCGACTVVVGEIGEGGVRHRAVNACILFLPMLEGRSVTTVEALAGADGTLHPCQQAMVEAHGSQCGFCTPGFVMSLYAAYLDAGDPDRDAVNDLLAGNLCRCTGYGPIIAAAQAMRSLPRCRSDAARLARERDGLAAIQHGETVTFGAGSERAWVPATLDDLAGLYAQHPDATIVAGATDVGLWVTKQNRTLAATIFIDRVAELKAITTADGMLRIGAGATYSEAEAAIARHYPDFAELIRRIGAKQVRNSGTIGGNIANGSPIGDTPPALIALGARIVLRKGEVRRILPLEAFFLGYGRQDRAAGELVETIEIPLLDEPERLRCYKLSKRFDQDISTVCGCFNLRLDGGRVAEARIAFGGMAATPKRATEVEQALTGKPWTGATVAAASTAFARDFAPITDLRGSAAYRLRVAQNLLHKYFLETTAPATATRLAGRGRAFG